MEYNIDTQKTKLKERNIVHSKPSNNEDETSENLTQCKR